MFRSIKSRWTLPQPHRAKRAKRLPPSNSQRPLVAQARRHAPRGQAASVAPQGFRRRKAQATH